MGADEAVIASTDVLVVEDHFREFCKPPQCDQYGRSANCPPHSMMPAEFRERLRAYDDALIFRIDVPMEIMLAEERHDVNRLLQETAAALERTAGERGYPEAWGIAADCCRRLFCNEQAACSRLEGGKCRNPEKARPSMSGMGVNFNRLSSALGWNGEVALGPGMACMVGVILLGKQELTGENV